MEYKKKIYKNVIVNFKGNSFLQNFKKKSLENLKNWPNYLFRIQRWMQHVLFNFLPYFFFIINFISIMPWSSLIAIKSLLFWYPTKKKKEYKKNVYVKVCKKEKGSYALILCCTSQNEMARGGHASKKSSWKTGGFYTWSYFLNFFFVKVFNRSFIIFLKIF